ncbi:MAG: hypothetical protein ABW298_15160 [Candidatus Binatia bacterium]|jgi:hypothetical protein
MKGWLIVGGIAVSLLLASAARAENSCVDPKAPGMQPVLKRGTASEAVETAMSDKDPGEQERKLRELTECAVAPGTPVEILEAGTTFNTVKVLDGSTKGCTGEILRSSLVACPAAQP